MNQNELNNILNLHKLWKNDDPKGRRANMTGAELRGAILRSAELRDAILQDAELRDADLTGAILRDADLTGATFNKCTMFPSGFNPIVRGMKLVEGNEEKKVKSPSRATNKQEEAKTVASKTLHEELSEVLARHGFDLISLAIQPSKNGASQR